MCGKCVILHEINIKNVILYTFSAHKAEKVCLKESLLGITLGHEVFSFPKKMPHFNSRNATLREC